MAEQWSTERLREMAAGLIQEATFARGQIGITRGPVYVAAADSVIEVASALGVAADALEECARLRGALAEARRQAIEECARELEQAAPMASALPAATPSASHRDAAVARITMESAATLLRALLAAPPPSTQAESGQGGRGI